MGKWNSSGVADVRRECIVSVFLSNPLPKHCILYFFYQGNV